MDYKTKYLKYKLKYLNAKKIYGGSEVSRRKLLKQAIRRSWLDANPKDNTEKDLYEEDSEVEDSEVEDSEVEDIDTDEDTDEYTDLYISSEDEDEDLYISSEDEDEDGEELKISKSVSEAELAETEAQAEDTAMIDAVRKIEQAEGVSLNKLINDEDNLKQRIIGHIKTLKDTYLDKFSKIEAFIKSLQELISKRQEIIQDANIQNEEILKQCSDEVDLCITTKKKRSR